MSIGDDGKVYVDESFCMYCGACVNVCPEEGALELYRISIHHTEIKSGAWNRSLEKLTSTLGVSKELKAKGLEKAKELVQKRIP
jgi:ferredoxin